MEDEQLAKRLEDHPFVKDGRFKIRRLENRDPNRGDFGDEGMVYFSWSTFDDFFENNLDIISSNIKLISANPIHAKQGLVPFVIGTDEIEIGMQGALILLKHFNNGNNQSIPLGNFDIYVPGWKTYGSRVCASKHNIPEYIVHKCDTVY